MKPPLAASTIRHFHLLTWMLVLVSLCLPRDMQLVNGWSSIGLLHPSSPWQVGWILPTPTSKTQKKRSSSKLENRNFPTKNRQTSKSPMKFEITDNDQEYQIAMDVPGVKREDIHVDLLLDDCGVVALLIRGLRRLHHKQSPNKDVKEFSQSFALDPAIMAVDQLTANLENGVLIVSAPKDVMKKSKRLQEKILQQIPIQVPAENSDDDSPHADGGGAFDALNGSNFRQTDPIQEEEEDLNAT
jgi:HSP20 family protein